LKPLGTAAKGLFMLCVPILLLTASLAGASNSLWLYNYGAERYDVSQKLADAGLELTDSEIKQVYAELIGYFNSDEENVNIALVNFTDEEKIHFRDVKGLIWLDYWLLLGTLIYILAYAGVSLFWWKDRRGLARGLVGGGGLTLAMMLALVLAGTASGFGPLFRNFHLAFFSNIHWSAEGYMLKLFQEDFFRDAALFVALATGVGAVISGGVGVCLLAAKKRIAS